MANDLRAAKLSSLPVLAHAHIVPTAGNMAKATPLSGAANHTPTHIRQANVRLCNGVLSPMLVVMCLYLCTKLVDTCLYLCLASLSPTLFCSLAGCLEMCPFHHY